MSGPVGFVNPRNDAFGGGNLTRAAPPTSASGSFSSVGAPGFPTPGIPAIASARNNRGSNIAIPYARVVPLHAKDALVVYDDRITMTGQKVAHEYDGLESAELAWVLGHQYPTTGGPNTYHAPQVQSAGMVTMPLKPITPTAPLGNQANMALMNLGGAIGFGVDRMQRLAYTNWVEAHFVNRVGTQVINLKTMNLQSDDILKHSSALKTWSALGMASRDMFAMPDIAYALQSNPAGMGVQVEAPMVQGLFVMERGPFLRSIGTDHRPILIEEDVYSEIKPTKVNRHLGSDLAQSGLEAVLKMHGVFNWTPDGVCMSKYETGPDGIADAQFDAKMSQLFNVAVQGSAITKTWTGDTKLICLPTDKVFILVVGDLSYSIKIDADAALEKAAQKTKDVKAAEYDNQYQAIMDDPFPEITQAGEKIGDQAKYSEWLGNNGRAWEVDDLVKIDLTSTGPVADGNLPPKRDGIHGYVEALNDPTVKEPDLPKYKARAEFLWKEFKATTGGNSEPLHGEMLKEFDEQAAKLRNGTSSVGRASLTNLRLMRATSSFMIANSHYKDQSKSPNARLGLPITYDTANKNGVASYVLGGWCIGTVLDSAASRTVSGSVVRVAANSMAMNINVNVEWWNGDKLYQHYQDRERYVKSTSDMAAAAKGAAPNVVIKSDLDVDANVPLEDARLGNPAGTMRQRDIMREQPSPRFSLDLDTESFDDGERKGDTDQNVFKRTWTAAAPPPPGAPPPGGGGPPPGTPGPP